MNESNNPFLSHVFTTTWLKHFNQNEIGSYFGFISPVSFVKKRVLPLYINVGDKLTKGMGYTLHTLALNNDYKKKVYLIYDVPTYFKMDIRNFRSLGIHRVRQYPGFLIQLHKFNSLNEYLSTSFNRKSRNKFRTYKKHLECDFDIQYRTYFGIIPEQEYNDLFKAFKILMEKRFTAKKELNNNLQPREWNFFKEVSYPMILEKKASLFVIFDREKPIGMSLNFISNSIIFVAMTVFDIEYSKYNVGSVNTMKSIEWGIENNFEILDFSKGDFAYKRRWANLNYDFEYHILYDLNSFFARFLAFSLATFFRVKQYLRDKQVNETLHRITFSLKKIGSIKCKISLPSFIFHTFLSITLL